MPSSSEAPNTSSDAPADAPEVEPAPEYGLTGAWGGLRASLAERGIEFGASLILDTHQIASGGIDRDTITHSLFDFTASFDLAKLAGLKDAVLVADAYVINGRNPTDSVGDFQSFSSISAGHVAQLGQLYYEQYFLEQKLRVKLGKADTNSDFAAPDSSGDFVHSASAFSPTIVGMATYPNPATCALAFWQPNEAFYVGAQACTTARRTRASRPADTDRARSSARRRTSSWIARAAIAGRAAPTISPAASRSAPGVTRGTSIASRAAPRTAPRAGTPRSIRSSRVSAATGAARSRRSSSGATRTRTSPTSTATSARALACTGCCGRADDSLGFYVSSVGFSEGAGTYSETAFEAYYKWQARPWLMVKPDVQYVTNPGGDAALEDALVLLTLRLQFDF